jgi:hypothetical protein
LRRQVLADRRELNFNIAGSHWPFCSKLTKFPPFFFTGIPVMSPLLLIPMKPLNLPTTTSGYLYIYTRS